MATINGTNTPETLSGTIGDDVINGLGGNDDIEGGNGSDIIDGGTGDDDIRGELGDDTLIGGDGNDTLYDLYGKNVFYAGDGQDTITSFGDSLIADAGAGDDRIEFYFTGANVTKLTGGAGQDTFELYSYNFAFGVSTVEITDFTTGSAGDILQLEGLLTQFSNYSGGNPFGTGHLRLVQSGNDTLLQSDSGGPFDGAQFSTLLTLKNVNASDLTKENFGGFPPDGSTTPGQTINGTSYVYQGVYVEVSDSLRGTVGDDDIHGLGGNDHIYGGNGSDLIEGGIGNDIIFGELGNDTLIGDEGDDMFYDLYGANVFYGGNGKDRIISSGDSSIVDGGADDDLFHFDFGGANATKLTGGSGRDTFDLHGLVFESTLNEITDFTPGATGDIIRLYSLLTEFSNYSGGNPFGTGYLRLVQSGNDTLLQADREGPSNGAQFFTLLTLKNVIASELTKENFSGFPPDGSSTPGQTINGTTYVMPLPGGGSTIVDVNDTLSGTIGDDTINGLGGNDTIFGDNGVDIIDGGTGNDTLHGELGDDTLIGGEGDDTLYDIYGQNAFYAGDGQDTITSFGSSIIVDSGADDDFIQFYFSGANITKLTGGAGRDTFDLNGLVFSSTAVEITDFTPGVSGDILKFDNLLAQFSNYSGSNPFGTGYLRLVQSGNDTLLQTDPDGPSNGTQFFTLITLKNVTATDLTKENFGGFEPLSGGYVLGDEGDDSLTDDPGVHTFVGRGGNDKYYVDDQTDTVVEKLNDGMDEVYASVSYVLADNLENLILTGTGGINGTGNSGNNFLKGNDGNNILEGGDGDDSIYGGLGRDTASYEHAGNGVTVTLNTTARQNTGAGNDLLNAIEYLTGSAFADSLTGNNGNNIIKGGAGGDVIDGGNGDDDLYGDDGYDTASYASAASGVTVDLNLTSRQNTVGAGYDLLKSFENLLGSKFNDTLIGNNGNNVLDGGEGDDTLDGGAGADNLLGGVGSDTASYASATSGVTVDLNITVRQQTGGGGFDYLSGIENLIGSGFNDTLKGKTGDSVLTGGFGEDQFVFMAPRKGIDRVTDFSHAQGDKLVFASVDYGFGPGHSLVGRELVIDGPANGLGPQFLYNSASNTLSWDPDGKGGQAAVKIAILDNVASLSAEDFLFV